MNKKNVQLESGEFDKGKIGRIRHDGAQKDANADLQQKRCRSVWTRWTMTFSFYISANTQGPELSLELNLNCTGIEGRFLLVYKHSRFLFSCSFQEAISVQVWEGPVKSGRQARPSRAAIAVIKEQWRLRSVKTKRPYAVIKEEWRLRSVETKRPYYKLQVFVEKNCKKPIKRAWYIRGIRGFEAAASVRERERCSSQPVSLHDGAWRRSAPPAFGSLSIRHTIVVRVFLFYRNHKCDMFCVRNCDMFCVRKTIAYSHQPIFYQIIDLVSRNRKDNYKNKPNY